jgi:hypothetical protein
MRKRGRDCSDEEESSPSDPTAAWSLNPPQATESNAEVSKLQAEIQALRAELKARCRSTGGSVFYWVGSVGRAISNLLAAASNRVFGARPQASGLLNYCTNNLRKLRSNETSGAERFSGCFWVCDVGRLKEDIGTCAAAVAESLGKREKECHPIPVVIGAPGQGKTEVLYWITGQCPNAVDGPSIIRDEFAAKLKALDPDLAPLDPDPICLFATFNADSAFKDEDELEGKDIEAALTSRVAAWYAQRAWTPALTKMTDCSLDELIEEIRVREGGRKLVILAIDEIRKIRIQEQRVALLDALAAFVLRQNKTRLPVFPIVSCLDVEGVLSIKSESGRPLLPIKLLPCPPCDMEKLCDVLHQKWPNQPLRHQLYCTNGHYRSLEMLANEGRIKEGRKEAFPAQLTVLRMIYREPSMRPRISGREVIDADGKSTGAPATLYECACDARYGIFYAEVDAHNETVTPELNMTIVANSLYDCMRHRPFGPRMPFWEFLSSIIDMVGKVDANQVIPRLLVLRAFLLDDSLSDDQWKVERHLSVTIQRDGLDSTVIKPLFSAWQPSDTDRLSFRRLKVEDLKAINQASIAEVAPRAVRAREDAKSAAGNGAGLRFAVPKASSSPVIEGVVFGLLCDAQDATKQYPLAIQMKYHADVGESNLAESARRAHDHMQQKLQFCKGDYYVLLCATEFPPTNELPKGTLVVGPEFLKALCRPFGLGPALWEFFQTQGTGSRGCTGYLAEVQQNGLSVRPGT